MVAALGPPDGLTRRVPPVPAARRLADRWVGMCSRTATGSRKRRRSTPTGPSCSPTCSGAASTGRRGGRDDHGRSEAAGRRRYRGPRRRAASCARGETSFTCVPDTSRARCCTSTAWPAGTIFVPTRKGRCTPERCASRSSTRTADVVPGELWRAAVDGCSGIVIADVVHANGVVCTADGHTTYLSDTRRQRVIVFDNERQHRREIDLSDRGHPDGMALDEQGALWVALVSGGIARLTPDGDVDRRARAAVGGHDESLLLRARPLRHDGRSRR